MKKIPGILGRSLLIGVAGLFILLSIGGVAGVWYVNRQAVHVTLAVFSVVGNGVAVVDSGVSRVLEHVKDARSEITLTTQDITTLSQNLKDNHPGLVALSERLETRLAPAVDRIQTQLAPVQEGVAGVDAVLTVANSLPYFQEKAPGLQPIQDALQDVAGLSADVRQLRTTLRAAAEGRADAMTDETAALLLRIAKRVDDRLARIQTRLQDLLNQIEALQERIAQKKVRILFTLNLIAAFITLMFLWIIYSQIVVIREQVRGWRHAAGDEDLSVHEPVAFDAAVARDGTADDEVSPPADAMQTPDAPDVSDAPAPPQPLTLENEGD